MPHEIRKLGAHWYSAQWHHGGRQRQINLCVLALLGVCGSLRTRSGKGDQSLEIVAGMEVYVCSGIKWAANIEWMAFSSLSPSP